jgi:hypothetical protein
MPKWLISPLLFLMWLGLLGYLSKRQWRRSLKYLSLALVLGLMPMGMSKGGGGGECHSTEHGTVCVSYLSGPRPAIFPVLLYKSIKEAYPSKTMISHPQADKF